MILYIYYIFVNIRTELSSICWYYFQVEGTIIAPQNTQEWKDKSKWIQFSNIDGLVINGDGHIDGQGYAWWKSCFPNKVVKTCHLICLFHLSFLFPSSSPLVIWDAL